ncbi:MAG: UvrD-helicase domain-containing protein [Lachnospiraceae bacterium]|nr:UvrD-helicase domain-containing protein [Lachnospiraceae bacterium]
MNEDIKRQNIVNKLSDNVFVEAGAGAGKTTLIVQRIINQLKAGIEPGEIVVITFTNAAAEVLRSRITERVRNACKDETISAEERKNLENAVLYLDLMNISTIHSFCFKLLQERVFDAKLPMDASLMEKDETKIQHNRFFSNWTKQLTMADWDNLLLCGDKSYTAVESIRCLFDMICELPEETDIQYDPNACNDTGETEAKVLVDQFVNLLCQVMERCTGVQGLTIEILPDSKLRAVGVKIKKYLLEPKVPYMSILKELSGEFTGKTYKYINIKKADIPKGITEDDIAEMDVRLRNFSEITYATRIEELLYQYNNYKYTMYLVYAMKAREDYRSQRAYSTISNDDLLQKTHRLICQSAEARAYYAKKIKCIYVDEFQDTDHIQEEFIWKLAACNEDEMQLRDGALFLVGDPKQSIYRFRGAEPEVYFKAKEKMSNLTNASVYCLDYNFRSNEKIISWVNREFEGRSICTGGYRNMEHRKALPQQVDAKALAGVYYYKNPKDSSTNIAEDANKLVNLIYKAKNNGYKICRYDKNNQPYWDEIKYSDFLVLCSNHKDMDGYVELMKQHGIPVQVYGEIHLKESRVLNSYVRLFEYLTHPYDRLKKAGAVECMQKNGIWNASVLAKLCKETKGMGVSGIATYLLQHPELMLPQGMQINKADFKSVQTILHQMVENVLASKDDRADVIGELFWKYSEGIIERELSLNPGEEAVHFMNLHKAKGLEGNIVVLTKRNEHKNFKGSSFRKDSAYYPICKKENRATEWIYYEKDAEVYAKAKHENEEERIRLEYVAATRAEQVFVVMDSISDDAMFSDYDIISPDGKNTVANIIDDGNKIEIPDEKQSILAPIDVKIKVEKTELGIMQDEPVYKSYSPSDFEKASKTKQEIMSNCVDKKETKRPKGNIFGTAMHRVFELLIERSRVNLVMDEVQRGRIVDISVRQAIKENIWDIVAGEVELYAEYLTKMALCFMQWTDTTGVLKDAKEVYTELPFSFYDEALETTKGTEKVWLNGTADFVVQEQNGSYVVYDYKSDRDVNLTEKEFENVLREKYSGQLHMYRTAVSRLFNVSKESVKLRIISFMGDENLSLKCTEIL